MSKKGADSTLIRNINRSFVLEAIRELGPITRTQIARRLGMSPPTVLRVVEQLLGENLVLIGEKESTTSAGRPSMLLEFNGKAHSIIAVSIGIYDTTAMLVDLCGNMIHSETAEFGLSTGEAIYESVITTVDRVLETADLSKTQLRGMVLGIAGIVDASTGRISHAPGVNWENRDIRSELQKRYDCPFFIENDVNLIALGEMGFGAARGYETSVSLNMGRGMGVGIIWHGALYHGMHSAAGEIGYIPSNTSVIGSIGGDIGHMLNLTIGEGIELGLMHILRSNIEPPRNKTITPEVLFDDAKNGESWAVRGVQELSRYLAMAITNVLAMLDPEILVIGGDVGMEYGDILLKEAAPLVRRQVPFETPIVVTKLGSRATAMGAIMLTIHGTTDHVRVMLPRA
jgi:predicted NBD/HSP70 family sugar kinase